MANADGTLLDKVLRSIRSGTSDPRAAVSLIAASARIFASRPTQDDVTVPTGFDPLAVALFEAIVEAAFLVATADGEFDATERDAFERVITEAAGGVVEPSEIHALVSDFGEQLAEDGLERRVRKVGEMVIREDAQREVLRIASLLAHVSGGVSEVERTTLGMLAEAFGLGAAASEEALADIAAALG